MLFKTIDKASGKVTYRKIDVTAFYGNVPLHKSGINVGRIDIQEVAQSYGWTIAEVTKARENWVTTFRFEESNLTFEQYLYKLVESDLSPKDVGNKDGKYNLSRLDDRGGYTVENCRFLTCKMNQLERCYGLHKVLRTKDAI